jgi:hypothetical protein
MKCRAPRHAGACVALQRLLRHRQPDERQYL